MYQSNWTSFIQCKELQKQYQKNHVHALQFLKELSLVFRMEGESEFKRLGAGTHYHIVVSWNTTEKDSSI